MTKRAIEVGGVYRNALACGCSCYGPGVYGQVVLVTRRCPPDSDHHFFVQIARWTPSRATSKAWP